MPRKMIWINVIFMIVIMFLGIDRANAHRVNVFAWVEGDTVYVEGKFSSGRKVKAGEVVVFDQHGNQLIVGKTNDKGEFSFKIPEKTSLKIRLKAGRGHQGEWTIRAEEIETAVSGQTDTPAAEKRKVETAPLFSAKVKPAPHGPQASTTGSSSIDIQTAVEKALDKKLKPIIKMIAESRHQGPTLNDIFGGIGYILGLVGIATYFKYRNRKG